MLTDKLSAPIEMTRIRAFDGCVVRPDRIETVVSPAYDSLTPEERHAFSQGHPLNYINVMRTRDEYPEEHRPSQDEILQINASNLARMLDKDDFRAVPKPSIFIYRLSIEGHEQTAVVCEIPIDHYDNGDVLKHENTRSDKEDQLTNYLEAVGASSSPVCLAYEKHSEIDEFVDTLTQSAPVYRFSAHDDVEQILWQIDDPESVQRLTDLFSRVSKTYLTDGHHRFAASSRYAHKRRSQNPNWTEDENFNHILVALFPADRLRILPFNRCVKDLNGLSIDQFLHRLAETFTVDKVDSTRAIPDRRHVFGMHLDGEWYRLVLKDVDDLDEDPVESLDVNLLQNKILSPILGITDDRSDGRLEYVAGDSGMDGLKRRCNAGWAVSFACHATSIDELMQIAESGRTMPPKSTYFDPKVRSGIFLRLY